MGRLLPSQDRTRRPAAGDLTGMSEPRPSLAAVVGVPSETVADLVRLLAARRLTVATAESLTGGLLTALLTEVAGSSAVVRGGLVVYATELKQLLAGVEADLLA